jgi:hypothetical protein
MKLARLLLLILSAGCLLAPVNGRCQLAITEAMSNASTNLGPSLVAQNSDYWELTNFGPAPIDLTGYKFDDSDNNLAAGDATPFAGLIIGAGESILFVQNNPNTNAAAVQAWWGTNLATGVKIRFYSGNGFSSGGDGIRLWGPNAKDAGDVIDSVDFSESARGVAFTYNPVTGAFGIPSTNGAGGAFKAELTEDVGSPGKTSGATPLTITQQPANVVANPGVTATFSVGVQGRPRGVIQWFFKGVALAGENRATLQVTNVQAETAGLYNATIDNGIQQVTSARAELVLLSQASAPAFTKSPVDVTLTTGQTYTFHAEAVGVPQPAFEWRVEGRLIEGATTGDFALQTFSEQDSGVYSVIARNAIGAATNTFHVTVTAKPRLVVTEVMSSSSTNVAGHADWWELTNLGTIPIPLIGYRFDDSSEMIAAAFTFTNNIVIAPGESVIFTEGMTPEDFKAWWGAENLPANLQVVTYRGNGLSAAGDAINVWNIAAVEDSDRVASAVFSTATAGVTFGYNADTATFGALSVTGTFGALVAAQGGDIGSPGYIRNHVVVSAPRFTRTVAQATGVTLEWSTQAGANYKLQARPALGVGNWADVKTYTATGAFQTEEIAFEAGASQRFFRVVRSE